MGACKNSGFKTTKDGLDYKIVTDEKTGEAPKLNEVVSLNFSVYLNNGKEDSMIMNTMDMNGGQPIEFPLQPPSFKGDWLEGLTLMTPGDSAIFRTPVDSIMKMAPAGQLPPWMKAGGKIVYRVKLLTVKPAGAQPQMPGQQEQAAVNPNQPQIDDSLLQAYFAANNIKDAKKTASGLYVQTIKTGSKAIKAGDRVEVNYTGINLNGQVFDSNEDEKFGHKEPLAFKVGGGEVIPGWDEGVAMMKEGGHAKLFVPSGLAYGPQARSAEIPANSILIFDVTVTAIK